MPIPATSVPAYSTPAAPPPRRSSAPAATSPIAHSVAVSRPTRWASRCAAGAHSAMHSTGSAVSSPLAAPDSPSAPWTSPSSGGTEAVGVRRLNASTASATSASTGRAPASGRRPATAAGSDDDRLDAMRQVRPGPGAAGDLLAHEARGLAGALLPAEHAGGHDAGEHHPPERAEENGPGPPPPAQVPGLGRPRGRAGRGDGVA